MKTKSSSSSSPSSPSSLPSSPPSQANIVISGVSGRYPGSENLEELWKNLMNKEKLYVPDDFPYPNVFSRYPKVRGALKDASRFDGEFFGFSDVESHALDPQIRQLLEVVYESMWDAGISPEEWRGTRTGFFLGSSFDDTGLSVRWDHKIDFPQYFSQRVSYFYDFRGPTMIVDTACAASLNALHQAFWSIMSGECDQAIVAGISIHLKPQISICFAELEMLSKSGDSRCLDAGADGYVRSEAIVSIVLQKSHQARRVCAQMLSSVTTSDGYTKEGITFPSELVQIETMKQTIAQAGLKGDDVNYVEAHITGTAAGDPIESSSILNSYRANSTKPIMLGCLKSSIGHAEAAAGLCAVSKVLKIFETGLIPPNINMHTPNPKIEGLMDGRIKPIIEVTPFNDKYAGIDAFGFGGANTHCIVRNPAHNQVKKPIVKINLPRILCLSNRSEIGIYEMKKFFSSIESLMNNELFALIDNISKTSVEGGFNCRSYLILDSDHSKTLIDGNVVKVDKRKDLAIVLDSNLGKLYECFKDNFIVHQSIISSRSTIGKKIGNNNQRSNQIDIFLQQIALVDLLLELNIKPKWIICQSQFTLIGNYACGHLSKSSLINHIINHSNEIISQSSGDMKGDYQVNHESANNNKVFKNILSLIKKRDDPKNDKNSASNLRLISAAKNNSKETFNLSTVALLNLVDSESCVYTLHSNMESELLAPKSSLPSSSNQVESFLKCLADLYLHGISINIDKLYPAVNYPVSCQVPRLGQLIKWRHDKVYDNTIYPEFFRPSFYTVHRIDILDQNFSDLAGYSIYNENNLFPVAGYLWIIWDHLVKMRCKDQKLRNHSFELWCTKIHNQATITEPVEFRMVSDIETNQFVIKSEGKIFVTGFGRIVDTNKEPINYDEYLARDLQGEDDQKEGTVCTSEDFYREMSIRGYCLPESYKLVTDFDIDGGKGSIKFDGNWTTFVQSILQLYLINDDDRSAKIATYFPWLRCDPELLYEAQILKKKTKDETGLPVIVDQFTSTITVNGLIMNFPEHTLCERDLIPSDLHFKMQIFLPYTSSLPLSAKLSEQLSGYVDECENLIQKLGKKLEPQNNAICDDDNDLLKVLRTSVNQKDPRKFLTNYYHNDGFTCKTMIDSVVYELSHFLLEIFEENSPNEATIKIKQLTDQYPLYDQELDYRFRKIRNNYQFSIGKTDDTEDSDKENESTNSADLVIMNHESLQLIPQNKQSMENFIQKLENMKASSFLLLNIRGSIEPVENALTDLLKMKFNPPKSVENVKNSIISANFSLISQVSCDESEIVSILFRKNSNVDLTKPPPIVHINQSDDYEWVEKIKQIIAEDGDNHDRIWLIANDSYLNGITGLGCSLKEEKFGSKIRIILAPYWDIHKNEKVFQQLREKDVLINVFKNQSWGSFRHVDLDPHDEVKISDRQYLLKCIKTPSNGTYQLEPNFFRSKRISEGEKYITNYFAPLNHFDLFEAKKEIITSESKTLNPWSSSMGYEFAGINSNGQRVIGICDGNGLGDVIEESKVLMSLEIPKDWSLRDASTVAIAYSIAFYSLFDLGRVSKGSNILLNGMVYGIGEAIIAIGEKMNFDLTICVDNLSNQKYLLKLCPKLSAKQIIVKNAPLDELILKKSNGLGYQVIINLDESESLHTLADCCSFSGTIIDINCRNCPEDCNFDGSKLPNNTSLISINPPEFIKNICKDKVKYKKISQCLTNHLRQGFKNGTIRPITAITYRPGMLSEAVELLESVQNFSGKVLIQFREETANQTNFDASSLPSSFSTKCVARSMFYPHKWYIILGGLGGVGLQLALWMISRGARKIVLASRSGIKDDYQRFVINRIRNMPFKVDIEIYQESSISLDLYIKLVDKLKLTGPIGGLFNLAAVLSSGLFENQSQKSFSSACPSKIDMTELWDKVTRKQCPQLDYFVVFSSIAAHGILGEANYSYSNAYIERIIENRSRDGLPGLAIQFGRIGDVGMATGYTANIAGSSAQSIWSVINAIDKFMQLPYPVCYSVVHASRDIAKDGSKTGLLQRIGHILGLTNLDTLDLNVTLSALGLDSLQAIEVQQLIESICGVSLSNVAVVKLTIENLIKLRDQALNSDPSNNNYLKEYSEDVLITLSEKHISPIFFFPPALFDFLSMLPLAESMTRTVIGVDLSEQVRELGTLAKIAIFYADKIMEKYPDLERYDFVGYSYGCLIGFEVAKVLQQRLPLERCDRIAFIDASPYGLKKLGQNTVQCVLSGLPVSEIFCNTMGHMGVAINASMQKKLKDAEDDEEKYSELVNQVMSAAGMNAPADAFAKSPISMIDRGYYLSEMKDLGIFNGNCLFIQVINKAHHGQESLVNEGLEEIINGDIVRVTYDASHFAILRDYAKEVAENIEQMMPPF